MERLMKEHPETDGIIYSIDLLAAGGGRALMDMGYLIPDQGPPYTFGSSR